MTDTLLWQNGFLAVYDRGGYSFMHEVRAEGVIVSVVPFRDQNGVREYLARLEICPAHSPEFERCSITGGKDEGKTPTETTVSELKEESGYEVQESQLIALGTVRPSKASDTTVYLYAVDVSGLTPGEATTDGSDFEQGSSVEWVSLPDALEVKDPLFITAIARLNGQG
jgi:8-oxo-dGTP pyrophosphatase MutT (NUDIX family)